MTRDEYDIAIVGAGIVGLATALMLSKQHPALRIGILEKEAEVGGHQTGHNSGVLHAGIYYKPGSLKARLCVEGKRRMIDFCESHGVLYQECGKVIVATEARELPGLDELYRRGSANGVPGLRRIDRDELREVEPHAAGIAALHSPHTGIVDYRQVARAIADDLRQQEVDLLTNHKVMGVRERAEALEVQTDVGAIRARNLINCAGLYADVIAQAMGAATNVRIVPFRGEYYFLRPERQSLVRGLIYPVPDPDLPFLGVHFTRTIHGGVEAGPNAVLAFSREGYTRRTVEARELLETVAYPGFWRLARRWWRTGIDEFRRSFSKTLFAASLRRLVPEIREDDLMPGGAGVRAQAVSPNGLLVDDFAIVASPRAVHVLNAPSPAATASLAIGDYIAAIATKSFGLEAHSS